jgi:hypothetical protein
MVNGVLWFYVSPLPMSSLSFPLPRFLIICILLIVIAQIGFGMLFSLLSTFFSLLLFNGLASLLNSLASLLFPPICLPSASTILLSLPILLLFQASFWLLPPGINCACQAFSSSRWSVRLGRLSWSRLSLTRPSLSCSRFTQEGGCFARTVESWLGCLVVCFRRFSLLGYLVTLQTLHLSRCFLRI